MLLSHIQPFHQKSLLFGKEFCHFSFSAPVFTCHNHHHIVFSQLQMVRHTTSGAKFVMVVKPFSFSSRGIGPNILPPLGSFPSNITTALSSNFTYVPSFLRYGFLCLTTTALRISFFLTDFLGSATLTETTTISPNSAYLFLEPPITLNTPTFFAPVLSATSTIDLN